jgi:hypothetical protein
MVEFHSDHALRTISSAHDLLFFGGTRGISASVVSRILRLSIDISGWGAVCIDGEIWD